MKKPATIQEEWETFSRAVFHGVNPTPVQIREAKRAFYSGAFVAFLNFKRVMTDKTITVGDGIEMFQQYGDECEQFLMGLVQQERNRN